MTKIVLFSVLRSIYFIAVNILLLMMSINQALAEVEDDVLDFLPAILASSTQVCTPITGSQRIIEATAENVAPRYNSSTSSPIARHGDFIYWIYIVADNPDSPTSRHVQLQQVELPENRINGPFPSRTNKYDFINSYGSGSHELRVIDEFDPAGANPTHTAPSVGVDAAGHIHVTGGMHHGSWDYCVSTQANDISNFNCLDDGDVGLPPFEGITYPRFFKHNDGSLYLTYRARYYPNNNDGRWWFNGTSFAALAKYNENTKRWNSLGSDNYIVGDLLVHDTPTASKNSEGVYELPVADRWVPSISRPDSLDAIFYSTSNDYHRYFRNPEDGSLLDNYKLYYTSNHGYQSFWTDMKVDKNGRIHLAVVTYNAPSYSPDIPGADPNREVTVGTSKDGNPPFYTYSEKDYILNYDNSTTILYAYSDNGGKTFRAANGAVLDAPISADNLEVAYTGTTRRNATIANGGIVYHDPSSTLIENTWGRIQIALSPSGKPMINFRKNLSGSSSEHIINTMVWNGQVWVESETTRDSGAGGGMVSDATGGLWLFESHHASASSVPEGPISSGPKVLYTRGGINGTWQEIDSTWQNGNRIDTYSANTCNVLRYIEMNIQDPSEAKIVSVIAPRYVK